MKKPNPTKHHKTYKTLAIIGNGFDLAHGYATDYRSFVEATDAKSLDAFREFCDKDKSITTWYSFEENINRLTQNLFLQTYNEDHDYEIIRQDKSHLCNIFADIHTLLIDYLQRETARKPVIKLPSVKKYLKRKTKAISFNYTNIAESYASDVIYAHGSLFEDDILLGYDYRDEACLAEYDDMRWSKTICREALAFRRFLKYDHQLHPESPEYNELIASMKSYQHYENSGRGLDEEVESFIPHYQLVDQFMHSYRKGGEIPGINYSKISTIVVLGHGIEADRAYLQKIAWKCTRLKKVVIFRYDKESDSSYNAKADFFKPYCKRIRCVMYR